jgi:segregation and condensation protein A
MDYILLMQELNLELAGRVPADGGHAGGDQVADAAPASAVDGGPEEDDPRAELVRRLQEYERYKRAAEDVDQLSAWIATCSRSRSRSSTAGSSRYSRM